MESTQNFEFVVTTADDRELREVDAVSAVAGAKQIDATNNEESTPFTKRKRKKTSGFWNFFVWHVGDCPKIKVVNKVDNAKTNDVVVRKLMENLNLQKELVVGGKLFHVRCCTHILNLLVQDGLGEIEDIIHNVRESVKHVNAFPGRLHIFSELAKQLSMSKKHLILDVATRWNATYAMLSTALEFKEVFLNYVDRESTYTTLLSEEDWKKIEEVCSFLTLFNKATKIISGSEYPTSDLFLSELFGIKEVLDAVVLDGSDCMRAMEMKRKFDKYWDTYNLLISIGVVLDPRIDGSQGVSTGSTSMSGFSSLTSRFGKCIKTGTAKYDQHIRSVDSFTSVKSELDIYLEDGIYIAGNKLEFMFSRDTGSRSPLWKEHSIYKNLLPNYPSSQLVFHHLRSICDQNPR
ncbi:hypothetical protein V6N12_044235 [Hibiscus sabdariffa]|uniref:hAT-like transposase RNase-H fold domain-containing protein n=1 Tax=Hibiscus sabdariffa TaxID=183260 RepID=A0ABR2DGP5_9ROSI